MIFKKQTLKIIDLTQGPSQYERGCGGFLVLRRLFYQYTFCVDSHATALCMGSLGRNLYVSLQQQRKWIHRDTLVSLFVWNHLYYIFGIIWSSLYL